jgi:hypothetical protein
MLALTSWQTDLGEVVMRGLLLLLALVGAAHAGDFAEPMILGVTSTMTVSGVSISSSVPTDVVISTGPLYRQVCVQNLDTAAFIACGENIAVSTQAASALMGVYLTTATASTLADPPLCFEVVPGKRFYCESANAAAASRAVIIRKR